MNAGLARKVCMALAAVLTVSVSTAALAQPEGMPPAPPPMTDSMLLGWVGTWGGDLTMGDQTMYGEAKFSVALGSQWLQGDFSIWTDKSKTTAIPMGFVFYIRPGATAGSYKAIQVVSDGSWTSASVTKVGDNLNFSWTYDNGMKETGTLTKVSGDNVVYKASVSDAAGKKVMDFQHDMHRQKGK